MGWVTLLTRKTELQERINSASLQQMKLRSQLTRLTNFASAVGSGSITPANVASFGTGLIGDALDYMESSDTAVTEVTEEMTNAYCSAYEGLTATQYANSGLSSQVALYFDADGNLDRDAIYANFYKENLKEYGEQYKDALNAKEQEINNEINELSTLIQSYQQEEQSVSEAMNNSISNSTIKFG